MNKAQAKYATTNKKITTKFRPKKIEKNQIYFLIFFRPDYDGDDCIGEKEQIDTCVNKVSVIFPISVARMAVCNQIRPY